MKLPEWIEDGHALPISIHVEVEFSTMRPSPYLDIEVTHVMFKLAKLFFRPFLCPLQLTIDQQNDRLNTYFGGIGRTVYSVFLTFRCRDAEDVAFYTIEYAFMRDVFHFYEESMRGYVALDDREEDMHF